MPAGSNSKIDLGMTAGSFELRVVPDEVGSQTRSEIHCEDDCHYSTGQRRISSLRMRRCPHRWGLSFRSLPILATREAPVLK